ncbi:hypothetical protein RB595_001295 [Gaeumannomyces hyphopodioides]
MASKASRWAVSEEDSARAKQEREAKRRLKAEKAAQRKAGEAARATPQPGPAPDRLPADPGSTGRGDGPPAKRRRLTPAPDGGDGGGNGNNESEGDGGAHKLLRAPARHFDRCGSVEGFDKLNDIEEGAYGWVARAKELKTGKIVALKRLKVDANNRSGLPVTGLREIQILRDCSHRNVVTIHDVVVGEDTSRIENIFLVLEFLEHDLKSVLEDMPEPFLASEIKTLLIQLASGVSYLHDNFILHRDLKTSNLLMNNRGQLKIADFGMARYVGDPPPRLTQLVVTLWYRAPELLLGTASYGQAVDMWSVGCIFGELLTREPLLQGKNEVDELTKIFELCGVPTEDSWPGFRRLPNARSLRLPPASLPTGSLIRARFPLLTAAGSALLSGLLSLDPARRVTAKDMLTHDYFKQDPKPKRETMFPTFPSKAGLERRRRRDTPNAPVRGRQVADLGDVDFSGIFARREREEKGGGFSLRMV